MNGKLKKLKDNTGDYIVPITSPDAVIDNTGKTLTQKLTDLGTGSNHTHSNKTTLDKLGESGGSLTFNGSAVSSGSTSSGTTGAPKQLGINPLYLPTADGYYQQYHPHVLYMESAWNGYKYWLAATPYPHMSPEGGETHENPHIYCSHDGYDWVVPAGLVNPIDSDDLRGAGYLSDTHLVYRPDLNRMECWYRATGDSTIIIRAMSTNGVDWSNQEVIADSANSFSGINSIIRSQSVIWDTSISKYKMWYNTTVNSVQQIHYAESSDAKAWVNIKTCVLNGMSHEPWHSGVAYYSGTTKYYLVSYASSGQLYLFDSSDGATFNYVKTLVSTTSGSGVEGTGTDFFKHGLYRACLTRVGTSGGHWKLYYSGYDTELKYAGVGVMEGQILDLKHVSGNYNLRKQGFHEGLEIVNTAKISNILQMSDTGEGLGFDYVTKEPFWLKADGSKVYFTR